MNLSLTYIDYFFYSKYYCGCPTASATGSTGEDKGCSVSDGTMFGSVEGGATFTSNPGYTPSTGWATSSWRVPSAMFARRASITHCAETCSATHCACGSKLSPREWMSSTL